MRSMLVIAVVLSGCVPAKEATTGCAQSGFEVCRDEYGKLWVAPNVAHHFPESDHIIDVSN